MTRLVGIYKQVVDIYCHIVNDDPESEPFVNGGQWKLEVGGWCLLMEWGVGNGLGPIRLFREEAFVGTLYHNGFLGCVDRCDLYALSKELEDFKLAA